MRDNDAKEGGRTPTAFRPLEPESSAGDGSASSYEEVRSQEEADEAPETLVLGDVPETIGSAARYLAALRADWDSYDAFAGSALDDLDEVES